MTIVHRLPRRRGVGEALMESALMRAPHVAATPCGDGVILLDPLRGTYYTLNCVGGRIWELLAAPTTLAAVVEAVGSEFEVPPDVRGSRLRQDVLLLLESL